MGVVAASISCLVAALGFGSHKNQGMGWLTASPLPLDIFLASPCPQVKEGIYKKQN